MSKNINFFKSYLQSTDWQVKENANQTHSLQGLNNYLANELTKEYWLTEIYPSEIAEAHKSGDLHIHDLGQLSSYCCGWDLQDLLRTGFKGVSGKTESAPAKHFSSALGQIVNFIYTLQGEVAGAQAFSSFDTLLAPFVYYDKLDYSQVKQAMQEFIYNMNVPTRVGFQTPFSNITLDLKCPKHMASEPAIVGGELTDKTYGEFQAEMDLINRAFAEVMCEGDAKGRIFTFPIPTYSLTKDFDWDRPGLEPVWEMTSKYGIPNWANYVNSDMNPEDARSLCCRLRLDQRELRKRGGGLFGSNPLTGSIGVVTLNLPRLGYLAESITDFYELLAEQMNLAKHSLEIKREAVEQFTEQGLYPYTKFYMRTVHQRFGKYWNNHFSTIGLVGMNEALLNLIGENIATPQGQQLAKEILSFMREKITEYQEETDNLYNLEATPAESTAYRLAKLDFENYPEIQFANDTQVKHFQATPYYTNSSQLPVGYSQDIFDALDLQDDIQAQYTGGTMFHGFLGESMPDIQATKKLVKTIAEQYSLPYFTITPTFSICPVHGYLKGESKHCHLCAAEGKTQETEIYSRIVGYLRPVSQWNQGKQVEFADRQVYKITNK